ncbi:MAG: aldehyde dehydrogenase family protein, partial [Marinomonas sp.]
IDCMKKALERYYPKGIQSSDYTSLANERQLNRLKGYLDEALAVGVQCDNLMAETSAAEEQAGQTNKLAFHVLHEPSDNLAVMHDEIFGPLLPILTYSNIDEAFDYIHQRPRPLAMYLFTQNKADEARCELQIASGSLVVNQTIIQVAQPDLPFGGVGASGIGAYHAEEGFRTFSHGKSVLRQRGPNSVGLFRPPYKRLIHRIMEKYWPFL